MPPYANPVNDFYFRNAQAQMSQYQQPYFPPQQQQKPGVHCSFVASIEEAKAARSDDFLSTNIFLDSGTGKIYLKKIDNNGKPLFLTYTIEESISEQKSDPLGEINSRLMNIENFIGDLKHDKPISGYEYAKQSGPVSQSTVTEQNESNGSTEPAGLPKNAGNGWRKK